MWMSRIGIHMYAHIFYLRYVYILHSQQLIKGFVTVCLEMGAERTNS